jgi:hypothetical protein
MAGNVVEVAVPGGTCRHAAVFVVDEFREFRQVLAGLLEGEEQPHVESERFVVLHGVHAIGPAFNNRRTCLGERVHSVGQQYGDLA